MRDLTLLGDPLRREIKGDPEVFPYLMALLEGAAP